ncbi:MAG: nuclear transport factor 2 family protein [Alphaproteobacteria bacterium]
MLRLPEPIAAYIAATNASDADALARCFAAEGRVHDEKQDHVGPQAIAAWAADTQEKYRFRAEPLSLAVNGEKTVLTARVAGAFLNSPITLDHAFELKDGKIVSLKIG